MQSKIVKNLGKVIIIEINEYTRQPKASTYFTKVQILRLKIGLSLAIVKKTLHSQRVIMVVAEFKCHR